VVIIFFIRKNIKKVKRNLDDTHAGYRILKWHKRRGIIWAK
jgi:hypothetical protein